VLTAGFSDHDAAGREREEALVRQAHAGGVRLAGPNSLGLINVTDRVYAYSGVFDGLFPGAVSIVTQSGAVGSLIMSRLADQGTGLDMWVSVGNEADLTTHEIAAAIGARPSTQVVVTYLESLKDPQAAAVAFRELADRDVTVLALKPGRTQRGRQAAASHTGALASPDEYYDALFRDAGVIRVDSIDEVVDCATIVARAGRLRGRAAVITGSGGFSALAADTSEFSGLDLATISEHGAQRMREIVPFCGVDNPIDPTTLAGDKGAFNEFLRILADEPDVDFIIYNTAHGLSPYLPGQPERISELIEGATSLPVPMLLATELLPRDRQRFTDVGITVIPDGERILRALSKVVRPAGRPAVPRPGHGDAAPATASRGAAAVDQAVYALLHRAGIPMTPTRQVETLPDALVAAKEIGFPVALKDIADGNAHKTESGGVALGIGSAEELRSAWQAVRKGIDGPTLVQAMVTDGIAEILVGGVVDDVFGPHVVIGSGGIYAEVLADTVMERAPVDAAKARHMLESLRTYPILAGARGRTPASLDALADLVAAASRLIADPANGIAELDLNPVIARHNGALGVDALIIRHPAADGAPGAGISPAAPGPRKAAEAEAAQPETAQPEAAEPEITVRVEDGIGWLTISNPRAANALTPAMAARLADAWRELDENSEAKVLAVTGAGSRHFCAGADLKALKTPGGLIADGENAGLTSKACGVRKAVVAVVNGPAVGLGLSFIADADLVVASANATFSDPHVGIGRIVSYAALRMATKLPPAAALGVGLGTTRLTGQRAHELGLVDVLVDTPAELPEAVRNYVRPLIEGSPTALRESLSLLRAMTLPEHADRVLATAHARVDEMKDHPDATEGPRARLERRPPRWAK
jgi:acyl-CoA synthetase (NDP forming)/enoyl-CoA hydratase/carnithine racemase